MVKYLSVIVGVTCFLGACHSPHMKIEGEIAGWEEEKIYLGEVVDEANRVFRFIDSAVVTHGKFCFERNSVLPELFYLGESRGEGDFFFAEPGKIKLKAGRGNRGEFVWKVRGSKSDRLYRHFLAKRVEVCRQQVIDSLEHLFYAARDEQDEAEMARLKTESLPFYEQAELAERMLVQEQIGLYKENPLGIYLYYSRVFKRKDFSDLQEIEKERQYLAGFGAGALSSSYKEKIDRQLDLWAGCAIGASAPDICGLDTLGNPLKLSDFRGKYVIVDFWNSYCRWCRLEVPWLKKAQEAFKEEKLVILGVSNDQKRELWLKAIEEDGSDWNHILLQPGDDVRRSYCIKGIPHIILVGPDGKILAKNMRHEELTEIPLKFVK